MILTITMNPSVDISYQLEAFHLDTVNRCQQVSKTAGGKGLNVSRVIHQLAEPLMATGMIGGTIGAFIKNQLDEQQIRHDFYEIAGESRNCIAILHEQQQTEILESGPTIQPQDAEQFLHYFNGLLDQEIQVVTISGSLPNGLAANYYTQLIDRCAQRQIPVLLDCSGAALHASLMHHHKPFLIKPNKEELSALLGITLNEQDLSQLKEVFQQELFNGIEWIVLTLGGDGALVKKGDTFYRVSIPRVSVVNPVGSGDATIAGLAAAIRQQKNTVETLQLGMTTGILNAMNAQTGKIDSMLMPSILPQILVEEIN